MKNTNGINLLTTIIFVYKLVNKRASYELINLFDRNNESAIKWPFPEINQTKILYTGRNELI